MLVKKVHAAKGLIYQLIRSVTMSQSELILKSIIDQNPNSEIISFISHLDNRLVKKHVKQNALDILVVIVLSSKDGLKNYRYPKQAKRIKKWSKTGVYILAFAIAELNQLENNKELTICMIV